jgi:hypothetical protein
MQNLHVAGAPVQALDIWSPPTPWTAGSGVAMLHLPIGSRWFKPYIDEMCLGQTCMAGMFSEITGASCHSRARGLYPVLVVVGPQESQKRWSARFRLLGHPDLLAAMEAKERTGFFLDQRRQYTVPGLIDWRMEPVEIGRSWWEKHLRSSSSLGCLGVVRSWVCDTCWPQHWWSLL